MKTRFILLLAASATLACLAHANEADRLFYEAVRMEDKGQIEDAVAAYEKASSHGHSASLHGNLANLYFRTKNYGKAILHYRKALLLDPNNKDIQANLAQVRTIAGLPNFASSANDTYFAPSTIALWCWTTIIFFWLGLIGSLFLI
ncbi:MAG: tetratricopeptide repeat protein, partial [Opitutales bacterium]